jgi:hypothetical protein
MTNRSMTLSLMIALTLIPVAWATVNVNTVPPPPPTAKLRLFVYLFTLESSDLRRGAAWATTHEDFLANQVSVLERTGIYEVVSESDVKAAIGDQYFGYEQMERNDWSLAREMGKGLHADYVMVVSRKKQKGRQGVDYLFQGVLINTETGKNFRSGFQFERGIRADLKELVERHKQTYRTIFNLAKEDMLAVAVKKSRAFVPKSSAPPAMKPEPASAAPSHADTGRIEETKKVLVYDFDSNEQNRTVALILAEALREEVLTLKRFALVGREDLEKARKRIPLQETESIDEKQAVSMGKGVAADQVVTGRLGLEGEAFVVQAKRTDVETVTTLGRASLTFRAGQEGEVMKRLPEFARELMGLQQ